MKTERRSVLKKLFASVVGVTGLGVVANAKGIESSPEKVVGNVTSNQNDSGSNFRRKISR